MHDTPIEGTAMTSEPDDALLGRYLVGDCSEDEKARVEEAFFADDAVFARMQAIEEDLVERHLRGELKGNEAAALRQRLCDAAPTRPCDVHARAAAAAGRRRA